MAKLKRVVLATSFSWPKPGGVERVIEVVAKDLEKRGYEVDVVCSRSDLPARAWLEGSRVRVHRVPYRYHSFVPGFLAGLYFAFASARTLRRLAKGPGAAIRAENTYAALGAILGGVRRKTMLNTHSVSSEDNKIMEAQKLPFATRLLYRIDDVGHLLFEYLVYNAVPSIFTISEYEDDDTRRKVRDASKVKLVRNGIDTDHFAPDEALRRETRKKLGVPDDEPLVLFVGRFVPKNGTIVLAEGIREYHKRGGPKARFVLVGKGSEEAQVHEILRDVPNVHYLPPQDSKALYAAADVFVSHVSTAVDGHGLTILEAMATGVPTVTGRDRIKEKLFVDGEDLVFAPKDDGAALADAMARLVADPALRARLATQGRATVIRVQSIGAQVDAIVRDLESRCGA